MNLRERIENNLGLTISSFVVAAFVAGIGANKYIEERRVVVNREYQLVTNVIHDVVIVTNSLMVTNVVFADRLHIVTTVVVSAHTVIQSPSPETDAWRLDTIARIRDKRDQTLELLDRDLQLILERSQAMLFTDAETLRQQSDPSQTNSTLFANAFYKSLIWNLTSSSKEMYAAHTIVARSIMRRTDTLIAEVVTQQLHQVVVDISTPEHAAWSDVVRQLLSRGSSAKSAWNPTCNAAFQTLYSNLVDSADTHGREKRR